MNRNQTYLQRKRKEKKTRIRTIKPPRLSDSRLDCVDAPTQTQFTAKLLSLIAIKFSIQLRVFLFSSRSSSYSPHQVVKSFYPCSRNCPTRSVLVGFRFLLESGPPECPGRRRGLICANCPFACKRLEFYLNYIPTQTWMRLPGGGKCYEVSPQVSVSADKEDDYR